MPSRIFEDEQGIRVEGRHYPVLGDVIILSEPGEYSPGVRRTMATSGERSERPDFSRDIQYSFGEEWKEYPRLLPEHGKEFSAYFDLVDRKSLLGARVCDLGCGIGRWSHFLQNDCRELLLVDFSDAVFVARRNLADCRHALFFMGDLRRLPFRRDFCDFLFCLGVLHHLPVSALEEVRALSRYAPRLLVFLYYNLDNRPPHYRWLLRGVTLARSFLSRIRSKWFRRAFAWGGTFLIYKPLVWTGAVLDVVGWGRFVPLYEFYRDKSVRRIAQDVYDRFFTRIEQRVTREDIQGLRDTFSAVEIPPRLPYWHFLCRR